MTASTGRYTMNYAQAQQICLENNATLATYGQMEWAQSQGMSIHILIRFFMTVCEEYFR